MRLASARAWEISPGRIAVLFALAIALNAYNSALRTDAHHWGLMLSNALDLAGGRVPYKDFIIQYGFFTTCMQSVWGTLFGFSFLSFGILTAIVYCGLLHQVHATIRHLSHPWAATLFLAVALVLHPFPIYPWADYYAGFFLSAAIAALYGGRAQTPTRLMLAGMPLGLAVWSRYTYAVAIGPFLLVVLISGRYSLRGWLGLCVSFATTNLLFLAVFKWGYGMDLAEAAKIYLGVVQAHGTEWLTLERLESLVFIASAEDAFIVHLWVATFPLFVAAAIRGQLGRSELWAYAALSILGLVNLIHAIRLFEYFRVVNSSFSLAIVSFWMIGAAVSRQPDLPANARGGALNALAAFVRGAPLILIIPLFLIASFSVRILWDFPLNTYNSTGHNTGIWRETRGWEELTLGKVGHIGFSNTAMLAFYRDLSSGLCGNTRVFSYIEDNLVGHICNSATRVRMAVYDKILRSWDPPEYQKIYARGEFSENDAVLSAGRGQKDLLCLGRREFITPEIEYVAKPGTKYVVRTKCRGKLQYGQGWTPARTWAASEHAEIHVMNYGNRPLLATFKLNLSTFEPRRLTIRPAGEAPQTVDLVPDHPVSMPPARFRLIPGDNLLQFDGDVPAKKFTDLSPIHLTYNVAIDLLELSEE